MSETRMSRSAAPSPEEKPEPSDLETAPLSMAHAASESAAEPDMSSRLFASSLDDFGAEDRPWRMSNRILYLRALLAMLTYYDEDGDMGVEDPLIARIYFSYYISDPELLLPMFRNDMVKAGILRPEGHNGDWHFQRVPGRTIQAFKGLVVDKAIWGAISGIIFPDAVSGLLAHIPSMSDQTYFSILALTLVCDRFSYHMMQRFTVRPLPRGLLETIPQFGALLRSARSYVVPATVARRWTSIEQLLTVHDMYIYRHLPLHDTRREVLKRKIADIEADGNLYPAARIS